MNTYMVIKEYKSEFDNPIRLIKNDKVSCIEESNPDGDWPNWVYCKTENNEGWVPKQIIGLDNKTVIEDYYAVEFNLSVGEILIAEKILNGWIWCYKKGVSEIKAWAPLNHLELYS